MKDTANTETAPFQTVDPEAFTRNMTRLYLEAGRAMSNMLQRTETPAPVDDLAHASSTLNHVAAQWLGNPQKLVGAQATLMKSLLDVWCNACARATGQEVEPLAKPDPGDKRFSDPEWNTNAYFDFWKQAYLTSSRWANDALAKTDGLEPNTRKAAEFYMRLMTTAMSPSNFAVSNPEVVRETLHSNGANLVQGMRQFVEDLERSGDMLTITQTDPDAFEVGRNLAVTPGKVVFQNDLIQLIQYTPTTEKVRDVPLLVVPPWINRYYILDLTAQKSFVKYAVDQGFTVFLISWVNPDARLAHKTFEDYVAEGLFAAADAVTRETGAPQCSVLGYCIGGTLVGTALAYLAARGEERFKSATFLTTQLDFAMAGDLSIFTDDGSISGIEALMRARGYLDGSRIASVFNMMRPQDLIWPYVVNNYLLGKKPMAFDILYWNQDSTRMPAANHAFYLRQFYNENRLARGELALDGTRFAHEDHEPDEAASKEDHIVFYLREMRGRAELPPVAMTLEHMRLNLKKVRLPIYELATKEDHIAPAVSVFNGARLFGGDVTFVLAGSGHIAGVVNPPYKPKYQHWTGGPPAQDKLEDWIATAQEHAGSWWPNWSAWLAAQSGDWVESRRPGARLGVIEDAPGSYVRA